MGLGTTSLRASYTGLKPVEWFGKGEERAT